MSTELLGLASLAVLFAAIFSVGLALSAVARALLQHFGGLQGVLRAGVAEVIKCGLLGDLAFFEWLERSIDAVLALDPDRIASFGYAHLPNQRAHQRGVRTEISSFNRQPPAIGVAVSDEAKKMLDDATVAANLDAVIKAGHISKDEVCKGVDKASAPAACK